MKTLKDVQRALIDPRGPEEWKAAMSNTKSFVYQQFLDAQFEAVVNHAIFVKIYTQFITHMQRLDEKERQTIIEKELNASLRIHKMMAESAQLQQKLYEKINKEALLQEKEIKSKINELNSSILISKKEVVDLTLKLVKTRSQIKHLDKAWVKNQKQDAKQLADDLHKLQDMDKIFIGHDKDGKQIDITLTDTKIDRIEEQCQAVSMEDLFNVKPDMLSHVCDAVSDAVSDAVNDAVSGSADILEAAGKEITKIADSVAAMADFGKLLTVMRETLMEPDDFYHKQSAEPQREAEAEDAFNPSKALLNRLRDNKEKCQHISEMIKPVNKDEIKQNCLLRAIEQRDKERLEMLKAQILEEKKLKEALEKQLANKNEPAKPEKSTPTQQENVRRSAGADEPANISRKNKSSAG